ncbi:MAG: hypothetical protein C0518_04920 [Opitutus sp.]|nr:hypothetical protein [Opitutus sp.]
MIYAHSADERLLYARTLRRNFPQVQVAEVAGPTQALLAAEGERFDAAVIHFNNSPEAVELLGSLRRQHPDLPIVAVSGVDRTARATAAGATKFVLAQEWLMLGKHLAELLRLPRP